MNAPDATGSVGALRAQYQDHPMLGWRGQGHRPRWRDHRHLPMIG